MENIYGWKEVSALSSQNRVWLNNDSIDAYFNRYFNRLPDVILYIETFEDVEKHASTKGWTSIKHQWLFMDDAHSHTDIQHRLKRRAISLVKHLISTYAYIIELEYPIINRTDIRQWPAFQRTWLPHSASDSFIVPYNRNPIKKILLSGSISNSYIYRIIIYEIYKNMSNNGINNPIVYHAHPGYNAITNKTQLGVGYAYAKLINRYFAAVTDTNIRNYIVGKVFEIPAAGALLILNSEAIPILNRLNWFENVHYVAYNRSNIETVLSDVLSEKSFDKYDKIRKTGYETALKFHTTRRRATFLHNLAINTYLNN